MPRNSPADHVTPLDRGKKIPPAVKEGVLRALATGEMNESGRLKKGTYDEISRQWGVSVAAIDKMKVRNAQDIQVIRLLAADRNLVLVAGIQDSILTDLADPEKMAKTSLKDKAMSTKALTDSAVTLVEGHTTTAVQVNFGELKEARKSLEAWDARRKPVTVDAAS